MVLPGAVCLYFATFILFIIYPGEWIAALSQTLCDQNDSFALKYSYSFHWKQIPLCADVFMFVCIRLRERERTREKEREKERERPCISSKYSYLFITSVHIKHVIEQILDSILSASVDYDRFSISYLNRLIVRLIDLRANTSVLG